MFNFFILIGLEGLNFVINFFVMYFDVFIIMDRLLCWEVCGLFGRCREFGLNLLFLNCIRGGGFLDIYFDIIMII